MKILVTILIVVFSPALSFCQSEQAAPLQAATIVFNGGYMVMHKKVYAVIQNQSSKALTVKRGGGIISEDSNSNVKWSIGNDSGYTIPFISKDLQSIPVSFNTSNAAGTGTIIFSTYSGSPDWKNLNYKPTDISNLNRAGKDDSKRLADRFWKIYAAGYTTNPHLKNLSFSYRDVEWSEDSNSIAEKNLVAQNWNGAKWLACTGKDNTASNLVKISAVNTYYAWWVLVDSNYVMNDKTSNIIAQNFKTNNLNAGQKNEIASLSQNFPNPASAITTISYFLPQHFESAFIILINNNGNILKEIPLLNNNGSININISSFASGAYRYSLIVDGKLTGTKQMIISK